MNIEIMTGWWCVFFRDNLYMDVGKDLLRCAEETVCIATRDHVVEERKK